MTDPRPSENTDDRRDWFGDLPTSIFALTRTDRYPISPDGELDQIEDDTDPLMDLIEKAVNAHLPEQGSVFAQLATARAVMENTTQLRAIATALSTLAVIFDGAAR